MGDAAVVSFAGFITEARVSGGLGKETHAVLNRQAELGDRGVQGLDHRPP